MATSTELAWDEAQEGDFNYFSVYGSSASHFDESVVLIGYTIGTEMDVSEDIYTYYHVTATDFAGNEGDASSLENVYAGLPKAEDLPAVHALRQNQPNPLEASTAIAFDLPKPGVVNLRIFDVEGRLVRTLTDGAWPAGRHSVIWHGYDGKGNMAGSGIYFVRMEAADFTAKSKLLLAR